MWARLAPTLLAIAFLPVISAVADGKPVALVGDAGEAVVLRSEITDFAKIRTEIPTKGKTLAPAAWTNYAAVAIVGSAKGADLSDPTDADAAVAYVRGGGTLILTGDAYGRLSTNAAASARVLFDFPALEAWKMSKMTVGAGEVYCVTQSISGVKKAFRAAKKPLGEADDKGRFELTEEGRLLQELTASMRVAFASLKDVDRDVLTSSWGIKPLGPIGLLGNKPPEVKKPAFGRRPVYAKGLRIAGEGVGKVVVLYPNFRPWSKTRAKTDEPELAKELAWHIKEMCPAADVELRLYKSDDQKSEPKAE